MKNQVIKNFVAVLIISSLFIISANATVMTMDVRNYQASKFAASDYQQKWADHDSTISSNSISEFSKFKSGRNSFSHLGINFDMGLLDSISFQFGLDAGFGGEIFLDGLSLTQDSSDLWWRYDWEHIDVLAGMVVPLTPGMHSLDIYWAEGCCNGYSSGRFLTDNGSTWQTLSVVNLDAAAVPEPASLALMLFGLSGIAYRVKKNK